MGSGGRRRLEFFSFPLVSSHFRSFRVIGAWRNSRGTGSSTSQRTKVLKSRTAVYPRTLTLALPQRWPFYSALLRSGCAGECLSGPPAGERVFGLAMIMVEGCHFGWQGAGVSSFWRRGCRDCRVWRGGRAGGLRLRFAAIRMRRGITGFRPTWTLSGRLGVLAYGESAYFRERVGVGASLVC